MDNTYFPESELIINPDGSIFHLHLRPEQLATLKQQFIAITAQEKALAQQIRQLELAQ